jgi:hypothetical protein
MPRDHRQKPQEQAQDDPTVTGKKQCASEYSRDHPFVSGGIGIILIAVLVSAVI